MLERLPKSLRIRFFSVIAESIAITLFRPELRPTRCDYRKRLNPNPPKGTADRRTTPTGRLPVERASGPASRLLDLRGSTGVVELLLDGLGVRLRNGLLDHREHALDEVLGFLEPQAGDLADHLDDADLVRAEACHGDGELRLLFGRRSRGCSRATT